MRLGLFTAGYQYRQLEDAFRDARNFGYDYIELWGGYPHAFAPELDRERIRAIRGLAGQYGIPVEIFTPEHNAYPFNYMLGDEKCRRDASDYLQLAISKARELGAGKMLLSVGHGESFRSPREKRQRLLRTLEELLPAAERENVVLLLEPLTRWESDTCTTLDELQSVLEEVDSPFLQGICDLVVPFTGGEDPADYPRRLGSRLGHLHLVDSDGVSETHLIPGEGKMPLKKILRDFLAAGYDGTATIELVTNYIDCQSQASKKAIENVKEILECIK